MKTILAPDPNPIKPKYVPPPGACDAHCHVFGPGAKFPYAPNRSYTPPDAPKEQLAALHKHLGFSRAVLVQASCHGIDNAAVIDALNWSRGAWRGVCMINDLVTDEELRALHTAGVRGARFNFVAHLGGAPDLRVIEAVVTRIKPLGWHLQVHLDAQDIAAYRDFLLGLDIVFVPYKITATTRAATATVAGLLIDRANNTLLPNKQDGSTTFRVTPPSR